MRKLVLTIVALAVGVTSAAAQNPISDSIRSQWNGVKRNIKESAEQMPEANYSFKPTPEVRSFGEILAHVAGASYLFCAAAKGEKSPFGEEDFEKTAKSVLTIWTYCVAPTSPSVSGGKQLQLDGRSHAGPNGRQMPSKFWIGPEIGPVPLVFWTTGSLAPGGALPGFSDSIWRVWSGECGTGSTGSELTAGEVPWNSPLITCGPAVAAATAAVPVTEAPLLLARAIPYACVALFPVVPAPVPPATATTTAAVTTGSAATTTVLRPRNFHTISHPQNG